MHRERKKILLFSLLLAAFVAGLGLLLYATGLLDIFLDRERMLEFIDDHLAYAAFIFVGLQALQVVAAPVPGEVTGFVGGLLFDPWWAIVLSTLGLTLGSWAAFVLARLMGRPVVENIVRAETMRRYDYVMKHKGLFLAFLMFLIPGFPKDILCYILGLGHMRVRDFLAVSITGRLLGTVLLTLGGTYFRNERWGALFVVIGIGLGIVLAVMVYRKRLERWFRRLHALQRLKAMVERRRRRAHGR
ncbi:MAG: TVP38/TMEM64 family protein [Gammaproteobacteria bacterium]|nr:MAG: TVP38/TMEM64 family protein [Gammaproteobacteria bacterium]